MRLCFAFARGAARYLALLGAAAASCMAAPAPRPNIVFILADDLGWRDLRCDGHGWHDTPHLDRLVARGTTFTHAYNMGSFSPAVCVASRTMLMTGRSLWDTERVYARTDEERAAVVEYLKTL